MKRTNLAIAAEPPIASLSVETLASVLDQSLDCVKLVGLDGRLQYMNANGQCAMEIDDVCAVQGALWADLWPAEARDEISASLALVKAGGIARFTAFCPTAKGKPRWWNVTVSPVVDQQGQHSAYLSVSRDVTDAEMGRRAAEIATAEMRHRLKNSYAMIASLMRNFARGNEEHEEFAADMAARMASLAAAQTLFAGPEHAPCQIATLVPTLVEPFDAPSCPIAIDALCDAEVSHNQADAIALVIGELAVNSTKHGAIGAGGSVRLSTREDDQVFDIVWAEQSRAPVEARSRDGGQGLVLMQRIMKASGGAVDFDWTSHGLTVTMTFHR